ncbi:MAG: leucine-rich repeat protein, partial [archaeon]|nr:leucine-rich repeat protein [archaeon]
MRSINYIVAAAMLFAACFALMGVISDSSDAAAVGDTITSAGDGLTYKVLILPDGETHGQVEVSGTIGAPKTSYVIPDTVEDSGSIFDIAVIGENAFQNGDDITSIELGANVITYRALAFSGCSSVTELTFHKFPEVIEKTEGSESFADFGDSELVIIFSCESSRLIPNGLFDAPGFSFKSLVFDVEELTSNFLSLYNQTVVDFNVTVTDRCTTLGSQAFYNIDGLKSVVVGKNVTSASSCVFQNCYNLARLEFNSEIASYGFTDFLSSSGKNVAGGLKLVIGEDVTTVTPSLFRCSKYLTSVEFGSNVTTIGERAFYETGLTEIVVPDTVTTIGSYAFAYCYDVTSIYLGSSVNNIGNYAFYYCQNVESLNYNAENSQVGSSAFSYFGTTSGFALTFGPAVKMINGDLFYSNDGVISVTIIGSDEGIALHGSLFYRCSNLKNVDLGDNLTRIPAYCFYGCTSLKTITIRNSVTTIGDYAFQNCTGLYQVDLGENVSEISGYAFESTNVIEIINRSGLSLKAGSYTNGYIAYYAKSIVSDPSESIIKVSGSATFALLDGVWNLLLLEEDGPAINLPTNVVIDGDAITSYVIQDHSVILSADTINFSKEVVGFSTDYFSSNMCTTFTVDAENPVYCSIDGVIYSKDQKTLVLAPTKKTSISNIPAGLTSVGDFALRNSSVTSISLPAGVQSIGKYAFYQSQLDSVDLSSVTSIGELAFAYSKLTTLAVPASVTYLGQSVFAYITPLTSVDYQTTIDMPVALFKSDGNLATVTLSNIASIGEQAFYGCRNVTTIALPDTLKSIGPTAFRDTGLTSVTIPASVTSIGSYAFYGCKSLTTATINGDITEIPTYIFDDCTALATVVIPDSVTIIGSSAFQNTALTTFTTGPAVNSIGSSAFYGCRSLATVVISDSVERIEGYAFYDCPALTTITLGQKLKTINYDAFSYCNALVTVNNRSMLNIEAGSSEYGGVAKNATAVNGTVGEFTDSNGLHYVYNSIGLVAQLVSSETTATDLTIASILIDEVEYKVISIGDNVFKNNKTLVSITLGKSVASIGSDAFSGCSSLESVTIPDDSDLVTIGSSAFSSCSKLTSFHITAKVTQISTYAFSRCALESLIIDADACDIKDYAFYGNKISSLTINGSVKTIGMYAFSSNSLTSLVLPEGTTSIGVYAFEYNPLATISLPSTLRAIDVGDNRVCAFSGCTVLESITVAVGNTYFYADSYGTLFSADGSVIYIGCTKSGEVDMVIPATVTQIRSSAFRGHETLETLAFEAGSEIRSILQQVFQNNKKLTTVTLPMGTPISLGMSVFEGDTALTTVELGGTTSIGQNVFENCSALKDITMHDVTYIGYRAFTNCSSIEELVIPATVVEIRDNAFASCTSLKSVFIPASVTTLVEYAFYNCKALESVEFEAGSGLTVLPDYLFSNCSSLTHVVLPDGLKRINAQVFFNCYSLVYVDIPEGVTEIGYKAFANDAALSAIILPTSLTSIGSGAFERCYALETVINKSATLDNDAVRALIESYQNIYNDDRISYAIDSEGIFYLFETVDGKNTLIGYGGNNTVVNIPSSVGGKSIDAVTARAFAGKFDTVEFTTDNAKFSVVDGVLYNADGTVLIAFPAKSEAVTEGTFATGASNSYIVVKNYFIIPEKVVKIEDYAFYNSTVLDIVYVANKDFTAGGFGKNVFGINGTNATIYRETHNSISTLDNVQRNSPNVYRNNLYYPVEIRNSLNPERAVGTAFYKLGATFAVTPSYSGLVPSNYKFKEWSEELTTIGFGSKRVLTATIVPKYSVYFMSGAGNLAIQTELGYGIEEQLTLMSQSKSYYTFSGWCTEESANRVDYADGATVTDLCSTPGGRIYLYAVWTPIEYTITFDSNGGTPVDSMTYNIESGTFDLPVSIKTGYTVKWVFDEVEYTSMSSNSPKNMDMVAKWTPISYIVSYKNNGGTGYCGDAHFDYDEAGILFDGSTFEKTGYHITGWNTAADGSGTAYALGAEILNLSENAGEVVNFYAVWAPNTYTVRFDANGGTGSMADQVMTYDAVAKLSANTFTKDGYQIKGWATVPSGADVYADEAEVSNLTLVNNGVVTLYVKWAPVTYDIIYHLNGGVNYENNPSTYNILRDIILREPSRTGYTFGGWYSDSGFTVACKTIPQGSFGNKDFYAKWNPIDYNVTYELDGGKNNAGNPATVNGDSGELALLAPTRLGYTFGGWYSDEGYETAITAIPAGTIAPVKVFAKWNPITYKVVFHANNGSDDTVVQVLNYGEATNLRANEFTNGFKFILGWSITADGDIFYADQGSVINLRSAQDEEFDLYAIWGERSISVTVNKDGVGQKGHKVMVEYNNVETILTDKNTGLYFTADGIVEGVSYYVYVDDAFIGGVRVEGPTVYTVNYWTVSFGDSGVASQVILNGQNASEPAVPVKKGYDFVKWVDGSEEFEFMTKIVETVSLDAVWTPTIYTVTYNNIEGATNEGNPATYDITGEQFYYVKPVKEGHTFMGWFSDAEFTHSVTTINKGQTGDVVLYAKWQIDTHTITFNTAGGTSIAPVTQEYNTVVTAPEAPAKLGYTFKGWDAEIPARMPAIDLTINAVWEIVVYKLTYSIDGAANNPLNRETYTIVDEFSFGDVSKAHYTFDGWYIDGVKYSGIGLGTTGDLTVEARFNPILYTVLVTYMKPDGNDMWGRSAHMGAYGEIYTPSIPEAKPGYVAPTEKLNIVISDDEEKNVYSYNYSYIDYHIAYELAGGTAVNPAIYHVDDTIVLAPATKACYDFAGWFDGEDLVTVIEKGTIGDITLVAKYTPKEFAIAFNGNGATGSMADAAFVYDAAGYAVPENGFTVPDEKVFLGWTVNNAGAIFAAGDKAVITDDVTLYAVWGDADITIVFDANGASGTMSDLVYSRGDSNVIVNTFTREHYTFAGWNTAADGSGIQYPAGIDAKYIAGSCTLFAQWDIDTYTVTYLVDGVQYGEKSEYGWNTEVTLIPVIEKTGYDVTPWSGVDAVDGKFVIVSDVVLTSTTTVRQYGYTVSFVSTSGKNIADTIESDADYGTKIDTVAPVVNGYIYTGIAQSMIIGIDAAENVIEYVYDINEYSISYVLDGGVNGTNPVSYTVESADITLSPAAKDGYNFIGWMATGGIDAITTIVTGTYGNLELSAVWALVPVVEDGKVSLEAEDGKDYVAVILDSEVTSQVSSIDVKFNDGGSITFPVSVLNKAGTVTMKAVDKSGLDAEVLAKVGDGVVFTLSSTIATDFGSDKVTVTLPFTLPAGVDGKYVKVYWLKDNGELEEFPATYDSGFATFETTHFSEWIVKVVEPENVTITIDGASKTVAYGAVFKDVVPNPTKEGYTFAGWFADSALTVAFDGNTVIKDPVTVYSKFTENPVPGPTPG